MAAEPVMDPLVRKPPELLAQREARVARNVLNTVRVPCDAKLPASQRWFTSGGSPAMGPVRAGNEVMYLIDGEVTFREMVSAIRTATGAGHFIYLLGWWLTDSFQLIRGDANSTVRALLTAAANNGVQVRAMLWEAWRDHYLYGRRQNADEVDHINALRDGAAILDSRYLNCGSHHQKILAVNGSSGLIAFCGGVDINPSRVFARRSGANVHDDTEGASLHDVHCRIRGPAAHDLLRIFIERWTDHPRRHGSDLRGVNIPIPAPAGSQYVQIGRTYGNGANHRGIDTHWGFSRGYSFAPNGEQTARRMILHAISRAQRFIYVEDQYLINDTDTDAVRALSDALGRIEHLTILVPHNTICDIPVVTHRQRFLAPLRRAGGGKVRVFCLHPPGAPHTYVHSKIWIIDDQFAIIGSANCNRRGWTHDSEVTAGIFDESSDDVCEWHFAHRLRVALWAEHLGMKTPEGHAELADGVASIVHWRQPPPGARIAPYDERIQTERDSFIARRELNNWDTFTDPDGS